MDIQSKNGFILAGITIGTVALVATIADHRVEPNPADPEGDSFDKVAKDSGIESALLRAINRVENPHNIHVPVLNKNGTKDYGIMQINERTFIHYEIDPNLWMDDMVGIQIAARLLNDIKTELESYGIFDMLNQISAYNVGGPTVRAKGIVNPGYVGSVFFHYLMFRAANG